MNFKVRIDTIDAVKDFCNKACSCTCDVDVKSGRYVVSGKSIMGLFSLSLDKPLEVEIAGETEGKTFYESIKEYVCE